MKTENWNGHEIRFVEKDGEWWAVLQDICEALELKSYHVKNRLNQSIVSTDTLTDINGRPHEYLLVNEKGILRTIFQSRKPQAEAFQDWTMDVLIELRKQSGLAGFEIFRMLDKEHQKEMMKQIQQGVKNVNQVSYIKANIIANKAVSTKHGYPKSLKKNQMSPKMLQDREEILSDVVDLMKTKDEFDLDISVSKAIYRKHNEAEA